MNQNNIAGAPYPLILFDKEGKEHEFQAVAFSDRDLSALDNWVQSRVISNARRYLKERIESTDPEEAITQGQYDEELSLAYTASLEVSIYSPKGVVVLNTPAGAARLAWQMVQKHHSDVKYDTMVSFCRNIENMTSVFRASRILNDLEAKEEGDEGKNELRSA